MLNWPLRSLEFLYWWFHWRGREQTFAHGALGLRVSQSVTAQDLTGLTRARLHERGLQMRMFWQHAGWPVASSSNENNLPGNIRATAGFGKCPKCRLIFIIPADPSMQIPPHWNNNQYADQSTVLRNHI